MDEQVSLIPGYKPYDPPKQTRKFKTMHELHGMDALHFCKDCVFLERITNRSKSYYKCIAWHVSCCASTDVRKKNVACGKFEQRR